MGYGEKSVSTIGRYRYINQRYEPINNYPNERAGLLTKGITIQLFPTINKLLNCW